MYLYLPLFPFFSRPAYWKCVNVLVCCVSVVLFVFSCLCFDGLDLFSLLDSPPGNELGLKLLNLRTLSVFIPLRSPGNPDFDRLEYSILYLIVLSQLVTVRPFLSFVPSLTKHPATYLVVNWRHADLRMSLEHKIFPLWDRVCGPWSVSSHILSSVLFRRGFLLLLCICAAELPGEGARLNCETCTGRLKVSCSLAQVSLCCSRHDLKGWCLCFDT